MAGDRRLLVRPKPTQAPQPIWRPCGTCGGQGRIYVQVDGRYAGMTCATCFGVREILVEDGAA